MKLQAFDSKRRLTDICCLVVGLGLIKLVFGAYVMAGGTLFTFQREEKNIDPKAQALAKAREKQLIALKKANAEIVVSQSGQLTDSLASQKPDTKAGAAEQNTANMQADMQTGMQAEAKPLSAQAQNIAREKNAALPKNESVEDDLLADASAATIRSMQAKTRHALLDNSFKNADESQKQDLNQNLDKVIPTYKQEKPSFSFSLVGTAHAEESNIDAKDYVRPDEQLANTQIPVPTVDKPYDSPNVLSYKEAELNQKEEELLSLQEQMNSRMKELNQLENKLGDMVQQANSVEADKYSHLIATYAAMKPRKAAEALSTLDEKIAVRILTGMKSKQSGEIFSYMDPVQAARLSKAMTKIAGY